MATPSLLLPLPFTLSISLSEHLTKISYPVFFFWKTAARSRIPFCHFAGSSMGREEEGKLFAFAQRY